MSSTYSSDERRRVLRQSPTEALAARYRHLFVLPSKGTLVILNASASVVLGIAGAGGIPGPLPAAFALLAALLLPFVISLVSKTIDAATIATFRRSLAAVFTGTLLWLVCIGIGLSYALISRNGTAFGNSVVLGAFLCWGFETLVINGAFLEKTSISVLLGSMQPGFTLAAILLSGRITPSGYAATPGAVALALFLFFIILLKRKKTTRGHNAVRLFQAFMKAWANNDASGLEAIIASHAEKALVSSKVLRFQGSKDDIFFVLPGIHPGPFYPVGSYNLPGLICEAFEGTGHVLALHRPGGHERNLATNSDAREYAKRLKDFAVNLNPRAPAKLLGPTTAKVGDATVTLGAFAKSLLLTVSFAPYGSEDLELDFENRLETIASSEGYDIDLVDAHNSIDDSRESTDPDDPRWRQSIQELKLQDPTDFQVGFAHSQEQDFPSAKDITGKGLGLAVIKANDTKWVIALADANNAVPGMRSAVSTALESSGYNLLEFCTSDSHDLAARGLTVNRGYKALGEATPTATIVNATVRLAKLAESRLSPCGFAAGTMASEVNLFGAGALREFAAITRESSTFSKRYARLGALGFVALLLVSLAL